MIATSQPVMAQHLLWVSEEVLVRGPGGRLWSDTPPCGPQLGDILSRFERLTLVCRVREGGVGEEMPAYEIAPSIEVRALPFYKGPGQFVRRLHLLLRALWLATDSSSGSIALLRLPGPIGIGFALATAIRRRKYAVQLIGDVADVRDSLGLSVFLRLATAPMAGLTRLVTRRATAASYVTRERLQGRYPPKMGAQSFYFSDVILNEDAFASAPAEPAEGVRSIAFCGSLSQHYKGLDVLLQSMGALGREGRELSLVVFGDGVLRPHYEALAISLGVDASFAGQVDRATVVAGYRDSQLFVMPSRTEGLPRALIEAMAQGLPAVASRVGGIPELLENDMLVEPNDPVALSHAIRRLLDDPILFRQQARRNLDAARDFEFERLSYRRGTFYEHLAQKAMQ